jgi:hypothetical protein
MVIHIENARNIFFLKRLERKQPEQALGAIVTHTRLPNTLVFDWMTNSIGKEKWFTTKQSSEQTQRALNILELIYKRTENRGVSIEDEYPAQELIAAARLALTVNSAAVHDTSESTPFAYVDPIASGTVKVLDRIFQSVHSPKSEEQAKILEAVAERYVFPLSRIYRSNHLANIDEQIDLLPSVFSTIDQPLAMATTGAIRAIARNLNTIAKDIHIHNALESRASQEDVKRDHSIIQLAKRTMQKVDYILKEVSHPKLITPEITVDLVNTAFDLLLIKAKYGVGENETMFYACDDSNLTGQLLSGLSKIVDKLDPHSADDDLMYKTKKLVRLFYETRDAQPGKTTALGENAKNLITIVTQITSKHIGDQRSEKALYNILADEDLRKFYLA